jgi:hypothetical protein
MASSGAVALLSLLIDDDCDPEALIRIVRTHVKNYPLDHRFLLEQFTGSRFQSLLKSLRASSGVHRGESIEVINETSGVHKDFVFILSTVSRELFDWDTWNVTG